MKIDVRSTAPLLFPPREGSRRGIWLQLPIIDLGVLSIIAEFHTLISSNEKTWIFEKSKMVVTVPKWIPVINVEVLGLNSKFVSCNC